MPPISQGQTRRNQHTQSSFCSARRPLGAGAVQQSPHTSPQRSVATMSEGLRLGNNDSAVHSSVSKYYGETLQGSSDLKTSACCTSKAPCAEVRSILAHLPQDITSRCVLWRVQGVKQHETSPISCTPVAAAKTQNTPTRCCTTYSCCCCSCRRYYGCGSPFPVGLQGSGLRVLDLGCGTGRDCYVCAALVGQKGFVTGVSVLQGVHTRRMEGAWGLSASSCAELAAAAAATEQQQQQCGMQGPAATRASTHAAVPGAPSQRCVLLLSRSCCCCCPGIDMTDAQLAYADKHSTAWQQHLGYAQPNMRSVVVLTLFSRS